jgi:UTP--glucose-1-phosphate uridylyltransferase
VGRERFLPVKTTNDLLLLRSDVYELTDDFRLVAQVDAPLVQLSKSYKTISGFDARFPAGPPSLRDAEGLEVAGDWTFGAGVVVEGDAVLPAPEQGSGVVPDGSRVTAAGIA